MLALLAVFVVLQPVPDGLRVAADAAIPVGDGVAFDPWAPPRPLEDGRDNAATWEPPLVLQDAALPLVLDVELGVAARWDVADLAAGITAFNDVDGSRFHASVGATIASAQQQATNDGRSVVYLYPPTARQCDVAYATTARRYGEAQVAYVHRHGTEAFAVDEIDIGLCPDIPASQFAVAIAHELGHALGFEHLTADADRCRLMFAGLTGCQTLELHVDDVAAVRHLYPAAPRLAGPSRYATAAIAAEATVNGTSRVVVVFGDDSPTAVQAAAFAGATDARFLLVSPSCGVEPAVEVLEDMRRAGHDVEVTLVANAASRCKQVLRAASGGSVEVVSTFDLPEHHVETTGDSRVVYVVKGADASGNLPDGLTAAAAAGRAGATVVMTNRSGDALSFQARQLLRSTSVDTVIVVGGPGAVTDDVVDEIDGLGVRRVQRVFGVDRIGTALAVAERMPTARTALLASSRAWPDAVAASAVGAQRGWPVLLTDPGRLDTRVATILSDMDRAYLVGGAAVLSNQVQHAASRRVG